MKKEVLFTMLMGFAVTLSGQVAEEWTKIYDGPGAGVDQVSAMDVDAGGNCYVTGSSYAAGPGTEDFATVKYGPDGTPLWTMRWDGTSHGTDKANAIAVDADGYVYVTGTSWVSGSNFDYVTIKYNPSGGLEWAKSYDGPKNRNDDPRAICVDAWGNVYVTGLSEGLVGTHGLFEDYATVKYSPTGVAKWVSRYNGPAGDYDEAVAIALDSLGYVVVTGTSDGGSSGSGDPRFDYATIRYDTIFGSAAWVKRFNGTGNNVDEAVAMAVDNHGNITVTGRSTGILSYYDIATVRYNRYGDTLWVRTYTGPGDNTDEASDVAVDGEGYAYVTGRYYAGTANGYDYVTLKYDSLGVLEWTRLFNGTASGNDVAIAVATDILGNVYISGTCASATSGNDDYGTLKYGSDGTLLWSAMYTGGGDATAASVAADNDGHVWVSGSAYFASLDYTTVKYTEWPAGVSGKNSDPGRMAVFPNPCSDHADIVIDDPGTEAFELLITDLTGKVLLSEIIPAAAKGIRTIGIDVSRFENGLYFCTVQNTKFPGSVKLIVAR